MQRPPAFIESLRHEIEMAVVATTRTSDSAAAHQTHFLPNRFAVLYRDGDSLFKFIATPQYGKEDLYDFRSDARGQHDVSVEHPELASLLRQ